MICARTSRSAALALGQARGYSQAVLASHPSAATYIRKGEQPSEAAQVEETAVADAYNRPVVLQENGSPLSSLAIVFKAGTRFESPENFGSAHMWKNSLVRNSEIKPLNIVHTVRDAELRGATLWTAHSREEVIIGTDFMRDDLPNAIFGLLTHVTNSQFQPYEFYQHGNYTIQETAAIHADPLNNVNDKLHAVAFRTGLGNHLYATEGALNHLDRKKMFDFSNKFFSPSHTAIVGLGINPRDFTSIYEDFVTASKFKGPVEPTPATKKTQYFGGEFRIDRGAGSAPILAYALPSVSFSDELYPAHLVLRGILDGEKHVIWGTEGGANSVLSKVGTESTKASSIKASYSDAGLIGFIVNGKESEISQVTKQAVAAIKKIASEGVSEADLAKAKAVALIEYERAHGCRQGLLQEIGRRANAEGAYKSVLSVPAAISKVSVADIKKLLAKSLKSQPSVVVSGNTTVLPHASEF